jgi:HK97 family phage portal protein
LFEYTQLFQEVCGSAYWYLQKNTLGVPTQIWLLCPQYVKPITNADGLIEYYDYGTQKKTRYELDEVVPFLLPNLSNPGIEGMSPLDSVFESILIENKYSATESAMLDNEGRPAGILSAKDGLGQDEAERWERKFNAKFRRAGNGGVIVLDEDASFTPIAFRPRDLSRLEIHANAKVAICNAYLVPPAMLNDTAGSQYNVDVTIRQRHV